MNETQKGKDTAGSGAGESSFMESGFDEARAAVAASDAIRADYDRWVSSDGEALQKGALIASQEGLLLTMRAAAAARESATKLQAIVSLAQAQAERWRTLLAASGNSTGAAKHLASCERHVADLQRMLATEDARFEECMGVWDALAINYAVLHGLPPSCLWQTKTYTPPWFFSDGGELGSLEFQFEGDD